MSHAEAGQSMPGHDPDVPMQIVSTGPADLDQIERLVVDAIKPFSSPAKMD